MQRHLSTVMPVLVTGIHAVSQRAPFSMAFSQIRVDGRNKSGHDGSGECLNLNVCVSPIAAVRRVLALKSAARHASRNEEADYAGTSRYVPGMGLLARSVAKMWTKVE